MTICVALVSAVAQTAWPDWHVYAESKLKSVIRKSPVPGGKPAVVATNQLGQSFDVLAPDQTWVTDITYIKTYEGWLYLAVVIDLFSRRVIGWSMQSRMQMDLVLSALLMAVWRRKPKSKVIIHLTRGANLQV